MTPSAAGTPPADGRLIADRYRLLQCIGKGGMGRVWAGRDERLHRDVAIKEVTPPPELTAEQRDQARQRTLREARAAARISSTAAVTVFDVVEQDDKPWIVMELLAPRTLADVLREEGPLPADEAAAVGLRLLDALTAAHAAGVLHRDVKPANVLYDSAGQAVLTDFGIASLEGDASTTTTGTIIGSPGYVAPERALGRSPSPASDLWSLGVTLAAAVHGRSPFEREGAMATLVAGLQEPLPDHMREGPLGRVLEGLLTKDETERLDAAGARTLLQREAARSVSVAAPPPAAVSQRTQPERTQALSLPAPTASGDTTLEGPGAGPTTGAGRVPAAAVPPPLPPAPPAARPLGPDVDADPASAPRRRGGSRALAAALAVIAVLGLVAVAVVLFGGGPDDDASGGPSAATTTDTGAGSEGTDAPTEPADPGGDEPGPTDDTGQPEDTEATPPEDTEATPPEDTEETPPEDTEETEDTEPQPGEAPRRFTLYEDPAYSVAIPKSWSVTQESDTRTIFSDPASRRYLLIEEGGEPAGDPVLDWQNQEPSVAQRLSGYQLLDITRADYRDFDAADWHFTWEPGGGTVHVLNRAVVDEELNQAYALYWSVPVEEFESSESVFETIAASFEPQG